MNKDKIGIIIVAILSTMVYLNTFKNSFQWDDERRIVKNVHIRFLKNIPKFFNPGYFNLYEEARGERYRPVRTVTFAMDYALWKNNPLGYHITNTLFHAICSIIVWYFVFLITKNGLAATLSSLLFAVHPVHTESITYIKNRSDVLCSIFYLISYIFFVKNTDTSQNKTLISKFSNFLISIFFFVLALLTKEMAVTLPLILIAYIILFTDKEKWQSLFFKTSVFWLILLFYLFFRYYYLSGGRTLGGEGFELLTVIKTFADYIKLGFVPYPLCLDRTYIKPEFFSVSFLSSAIILTVFVILTVKSKRQNKFFLLFMLLTLLPVSNILLIKHREFAEQRFYLPSIGICAFLGIIFEKYFSKKYVKIVFMAVVLLFSYLTLMRNFDYKDDTTLWLKTITLSPSTRAFNNLGTAYWDKKYYSDAIISWKKAIELDDKNAEAFANLGAASFELGLYNDAIEYFKKAIEIEPWSYEAVSNLGAAYSIKGDYKNALETHKQAVNIAPWVASTHYNLGVTYLRTDDFKNAEKEFNEALAYDPFHWQSYLRLSEMFEQFGQKEKSTELFNKSQEIKNQLSQ
ncbi:MAG TPA: hypothetical protein DCX95_03820 [Elusimicrobia bacterium]|nr:hypothetical protein [Elusimicrobiota bacterium]